MTTAYSSEHLPNGYTTTAAGSYTNGSHAPRPMDGRQGEYQPGLNSPKQPEDEHHFEGSFADQSSAAQYTPQQDVKYNPAATPNSDYSLNPSSARSGTFPEYNNAPRTAAYPDGSQRYHPSAGPTGAGNMAQPTSPSMSPPEGQDGQADNHQAEPSNETSDQNIPVDPSIAQSSPTYPPPHYPGPYTPQHDMSQYHGQPMYRPDYPGPYSAPHMGYGHVPTSVVPPFCDLGANDEEAFPNTSAYTYTQGGHPLSTVYSFVPIPGTHQQKRPRRRYEEIERMYKCGWNGCEKAYGTLNHLNAHVTMQSHGSKRTPEEFKEIRKEWKARKKEEDNARKQEDERARSAQVQQPQPHPQEGQSSSGDGTPQQQHPPPGGYNGGVRQLPPLGYAPASGQVPAQYAQTQAGMDGMPQYPNGQMPHYGGGYQPQSPYGQTQQM